MPSLMVLDLMMLGMDRWEFFAASVGRCFDCRYSYDVPLEFASRTGAPIGPNQSMLRDYGLSSTSIRFEWLRTSEKDPALVLIV
jgi:hypothetical protein